MFGTSVGHIISCGVAGTALMSVFIYTVSSLSGRLIRVTRILGTMVTNKAEAPGRKSNNSPPVISIGTLIHYFIGVLFSLVYFFLWHHGIGRPNFLQALVFGVVSGVVAVCAWALFFRIHPYPPKLSYPFFLFLIFLGHIVFAIGVVTAHKLTGTL